MSRIHLSLLAAAALLSAFSSAGCPAAAEAWLRIDRPAALQRATLPPEALDYGHFIWLPERAANRIAGAQAAHRFERPFDMRIDEAYFDPTKGFPELPEEWLRTAHGPGNDWHLVQFEGPIRPEWLDRLRQSGLEPVQYMAPFGYIVWGRAKAVDAARSLNHLRFAGSLPPIMRVPQASRAVDEAGSVMAMALIHRGEEQRIIRALTAAGATIQQRRAPEQALTMVELETTSRHLIELARIPGVLTLQRIADDGGPRGERSGQSLLGDHDDGGQLAPGYQQNLAAMNVDGSGVTVSVVDGGIRESHVDLADRMRPCESLGELTSSCSKASDSHGTHVAGAIAGTGTSGVTANGFLRGLGIAPGAGLVQQRYCDFLGPERSCGGAMAADAMLTIFGESAASAAVIANNSWGPAGSPQGYDIPTRQLDMITRDAAPQASGKQPVLPVWAINNGKGDGSASCAPSSLGSPDEAKNLLAVGSTALQSRTDDTMLDLSDNSAHGPACDGRLVPQIVAPGCYTDSTNSLSDTAFIKKCGTSMAAPIVAGVAALFFEQYQSRHGRFPSPALTRAMLTASARDLAGKRDADDNTMGHRPDRKQGWGRIQLDRTLAPELPTAMIDQTTTFTASGQAWTGSFTIADPSQPVQVQLAWSDAPGPGTGGTTPAWVNDLDLSVEVDGKEYLGNNIDSDSGWSIAGGAPDIMNNLEGVALSPSQYGGQTLTVTVSAINLAGDALDPWQPASPRQDFALVGRNLAAPGQPVALQFVEQPVSAQSGSNLDPIGVQLVDSSGNDVTLVNERDIVIELDGCTSLTPLAGTKHKRTQNGLAEFDDLTINAPGLWRMRGSSSDAAIESALSDAFSIGSMGLFDDRFEATCLP